MYVDANIIHAAVKGDNYNYLRLLIQHLLEKFETELIVVTVDNPNWLIFFNYSLVHLGRNS